MLIQSQCQRFQNATSLKNEFRNGSGVRNRLHKLGLNARRPAIRIPFTRQHVQDRLDFARTHVRWINRDWIQYYSLMSPDSISSLLINVSWCGNAQTEI